MTYSPPITDDDLHGYIDDALKRRARRSRTILTHIPMSP